MLVRILTIALMIACLTPMTQARQASMSEQEQRDELASVIEERVRLHERRIVELQAQLEALRDGADLATVRESLRGATPAPAAADRPVPGRPGNAAPEGERRRGFGRDRDRDAATGEGRPEPRRPQGREGERPEITPEMVDGMLLMIRQEKPVFADRLERLREERPEAFRRIVGRMLEEFSKDDDELTSLGIQVRASEVELRDLAGRVRENPEESAALAEEVRAALNAAADARIAYERARLERDGQQLETRKRFLDTMEAKRSEFIEQRLQAIMGGEDLVKIPGRERRERERPERTPDGRPQD